MAFSDLLGSVNRIVTEVTGGDPVSYAPGVGSPVTVKAIFDVPYAFIEVGTAGISGSGPVMFVLLGDLPSDPETDEDATITHDGTTYTIAQCQKDGKGGVRMLLHKV